MIVREENGCQDDPLCWMVDGVEGGSLHTVLRSLGILRRSLVYGNPNT